MKNISTIIFLFLSVSFSQESDTTKVQESNNKIGIGLEFHTWPTTMLTSENSGMNGLSLFYPLSFSGLFIEPEISYWSYNEKKIGLTEETEYSNLRFLLGLFFQKTHNKSNYYIKGCKEK